MLRKALGYFILSSLVPFLLLLIQFSLPLKAQESIFKIINVNNNVYLSIIVAGYITVAISVGFVLLIIKGMELTKS